MVINSINLNIIIINLKPGLYYNFGNHSVTTLKITPNLLLYIKSVKTGKKTIGTVDKLRHALLIGTLNICTYGKAP